MNGRCDKPNCRFLHKDKYSKADYTFKEKYEKELAEKKQKAAPAADAGAASGNAAGAAPKASPKASP